MYHGARSEAKGDIFLWFSFPCSIYWPIIIVTSFKQYLSRCPYIVPLEGLTMTCVKVYFANAVVIIGRNMSRPVLSSQLECHFSIKHFSLQMFTNGRVLRNWMHREAVQGMEMSSGHRQTLRREMEKCSTICAQPILFIVSNTWPNSCNLPQYNLSPSKFWGRMIRLSSAVNGSAITTR